MIHRMLRYPAGWEWHVLQQPGLQAARKEPLPSRKSAQKQNAAARDEQSAVKAITKTIQNSAGQQLEELKQQFPECAIWADECEGRRTNSISVGEVSDAEKLLHGTLMFQITDDPTDVQPFHFFLTSQRLITLHEDMRLPLRLQSLEHTSKLDSCETAPEALFIMINIILEAFHNGLDGFEKRLGELEKTMQRDNRNGLIDTIFERRYDLLHWSHLFIPIREVHSAAQEAFMQKLTDTDIYKRSTHKLERIDVLLKHYSLEIDTLISMDDAISNFRGNDIMKTLTIYTVLFLPATIFGTIWGVNFENLPFKDHKWSFTAMISAIIVITLIMYFWLWKKGWTGDLLKKPNSKGIVTGNDSTRTGRSRSSKSKNRRSVRPKPASSPAPTTAEHVVMEPRSKKNRS